MSRHITQLDNGILVAVDPSANTVEVSVDAGATWREAIAREPEAAPRPRTREEKKDGGSA